MAGNRRRSGKQPEKALLHRRRRLPPQRRSLEAGESRKNDRTNGAAQTQGPTSKETQAKPQRTEKSCSCQLRPETDFHLGEQGRRLGKKLQGPVPGKTTDKGSAVVKRGLESGPRNSRLRETPSALCHEKRPAVVRQIVYIRLDRLTLSRTIRFAIAGRRGNAGNNYPVSRQRALPAASSGQHRDGGYEIVSGHRRQKTSELARHADMPVQSLENAA